MSEVNEPDSELGSPEELPVLSREININPKVEQRADIKLYLDSFRVRRFSSLNGTRTIADIFNILDMVLFFHPAGEYALKKLDEYQNLHILLEPAISRNTPGILKPGSYLIDPVSLGTMILERVVFAFTHPDIKSIEKKTQLVHSSVASFVPSESMATGVDPVMSSKDEYSFKKRLVYRDKGCVVCHAKGTPKDYHHEDHSNHIHGAHIFPFSMQESWNRREHSKLIADPYTSFDSFNAERNKEDPSRINSLENGLLLCLEHHAMYDAFEYSIDPATHEIYAFSSTASDIHGLEVTRPWSLSLSSQHQFQLPKPDPRFPPPHPMILKDHFISAIFENMKAAAEPTEDYDDSDSDFEGDSGEDE